MPVGYVCAAVEATVPPLTVGKEGVCVPFAPVTRGTAPWWRGPSWKLGRAKARVAAKATRMVLSCIAVEV